MTKTALVVGATGIVGRRIVDHLSESGWNVIGLSRRARESGRVRWIAVELNDLADCRQRLGGLGDVTHVFYAARHDHPEGVAESVDINAAMLTNLVSALEPVAPLRHVHAVHGAKYYDHRVAPGTVLTEDSRRSHEPNFYFEQEDFLRAQSRGKAWSFTTSRPYVVCDRDYPRSVSLIIAVYALIRRELGLKLDFPGSATTFEARLRLTDTGHLARCIAWMAQEPRCAGQAFNVANSDNPSWAALWPGFAEYFGMKSDGPSGTSLVQYMADKGPVWERIVKTHGLAPVPLDAVALWPYGDRHFRREWQAESTMAKARAFGFSETLASADMFARHFVQFGIARKK